MVSVLPELTSSMGSTAVVQVPGLQPMLREMVTVLVHTDIIGSRRREDMKRIKNAVIIGMGALGLLFGQRICENLPDGSMCFLMDAERKKRHSRDLYTINGKAVSFRMMRSMNGITG